MTVKKPVLVVGSINTDVVVSTLRLPEKGETVFGKTVVAVPGGKGANQAVAASKLGAQVTLVGCVGNDAAARELRASLQSNKVDTTFIREVATTTGTTLITTEEGGDNTVVVVAGANSCCSPSDVDAALDAIGEPGILLVQNELPEETVEHAIKTAKARCWTVILNPSPVRSFDLENLLLVDIILPNQAEMALLTNRSVETPDEAIFATSRLLNWGLDTVIVTLGAQGAVCCNNQVVEYVPSYSVTTVDTAAAGDAYAGALATALAEGKVLGDCMQFAAAAAALTVNKAGAQSSLPWREEVEAFMQNREVASV
jgi:ribokinase